MFPPNVYERRVYSDLFILYTGRVLSFYEGSGKLFFSKFTLSVKSDTLRSLIPIKKSKGFSFMCYIALYITVGPQYSTSKVPFIDLLKEV